MQSFFTSRLRGMELLNYWERLEALELYSLERCRDRYIAIYIWKMVVGLSPNLDGTDKLSSNRTVEEVKPAGYHQ